MFSYLKSHRRVLKTLHSIVHTKRTVRKTSSILDATTSQEFDDLSEESLNYCPDNEGSESGAVAVKEEDPSHSESEAQDELPGETKPLQVPPGVGIQSRPAVLLQRKEIQKGELLGHGSFSEVYAVSGLNLDPCKKSPANSCSRDELAHRQDFLLSFQQGPEVPPKYAIKHLSRKLLRRPKHFHQAAMDLSREASFMTALDHPHILKLRGITVGGTAAFAETGRFDSFFIVTDYLSDTLAQRISQWQQFPVFQVMDRLPKLIMKTQYAYQLASAMDYLHDRRIIYRDLKPANIGFLGNARDTVKLFDFGISRTLPPSTKTDSAAPSFLEAEETFLMSLAGTTRYMSPEVLATGRYNLKADVHSFAMVMYEMFAESKPYSAMGHHCFYEFVRGMRVRPNVHHLHLPLALEALIVGSWCPELEERFSMSDVCEVLPLILEEMEGRIMENEVEC